MLAGMVALVLVVRPLVLLADIAIRHTVLIPGATSLIRWQSHWHVIRQSWPFFQNDFAGRIANRVMQTAHALRESVMASIRAVWYIGAYGDGVRPDGHGGLAARRADAALVRELPRVPPAFRAAHAATSRARARRRARW